MASLVVFQLTKRILLHRMASWFPFRFTLLKAGHFRWRSLRTTFPNFGGIPVGSKQLDPGSPNCITNLAAILESSFLSRLLPTRLGLGILNGQNKQLTNFRHRNSIKSDNSIRFFWRKIVNFIFIGKFLKIEFFRSILEFETVVQILQV